MGNTPDASASLVDQPIDSSIVDEPIVTEEPTGDETAAEPEAEGDTPPESGTPEGDKGKGTPDEDGRRLPQYIRSLKESNPEAYKAAKAGFFDLASRRSIHPTIQAAREEHELVESLGGSEGIQSLREDGNFFKEAANQFLKGDPAFVNDLWEEDKIAAALHVQPMLEQFRKHDFEGYASTLARLWKTELDTVEFAPALDDMIKLIQAGDKDKALVIANSIKNWHRSVDSRATKAEDPRVKSLLAERSQARDKEESTRQEEFLKTYRTDTMNEVVQVADKVFGDIFKGKKIDKDDRTDLLREALALANRNVMKDAEFAKQRDAHLKNGDSKAALRLTKNRFAKELPDAVRRIARRYGMTSGTPLNTGKQNSKQPAGSGANQSGYVAVNYRPQAEDIDRSRTSQDDIMVEKRAILKDGKKVTWAAFAKSQSAA